PQTKDPDPAQAEEAATAQSRSQAEGPESAARPETTPAGPPSSPGTRVLGLLYVLLGGGLLAFLSWRAFAQDFGTENPRVLWTIRVASVALPAYPLLLGLWALIRGRRPPDAVNPFLLPFEGWWFDALGVLAWRELKRYFFHPVAYVVLGVFLSINGVVIRAVLDSYAGFDQFRELSLPASYWITVHTLLWLSLAVLLPAITMRLLAEEDRAGTLEMLLTAPVTEVQVVLSKFLAAFAYTLFMVVMTAAYQFIVKAYSEEWDWGPVLGGYLGLALACGLFVAVGLFFSSITRSQILAYVYPAVVLLFVVVFVPWWADQTAVSDVAERARAFVRYINVLHHQREMAKGILSFSTLTFYVTSTAYFLFLAVRGLEAHKWR
ncbi:MAG: hypothetical protein D6731_18110, partial [Planctomycetota bacterium]